MRKYYTFLTDGPVAKGMVIREHGQLFLATEDSQEKGERWQTQYTQYTEKLIPPIFEDGKACPITEVEALAHSVPAAPLDERHIAFFMKHGASREEAILVLRGLSRDETPVTYEQRWDGQRWMQSALCSSDMHLRRSILNIQKNLQSPNSSGSDEWHAPFTMSNLLDALKEELERRGI